MDEFNEQAIIDFIRTKLPEGSRERLDDDEILNVVDIIWDYYEDNGLLEINADIDDDDDLDVEALMAYVKKMIRKDRRSPLTPEEVEVIVNAELEYEEDAL